MDKLIKESHIFRVLFLTIGLRNYNTYLSKYKPNASNNDLKLTSIVMVKVKGFV